VAELYHLNYNKCLFFHHVYFTVEYLSESIYQREQVYQIRPEVDGTSMYDVQIAFIFPMLQNTEVKGDWPNNGKNKKQKEITILKMEIAT
jgi:hypothetical protein